MRKGQLIAQSARGGAQQRQSVAPALSAPPSLATDVRRDFEYFAQNVHPIFKF